MALEMAPTGAVLTQVDGAVATVVLNRPHRRNAVSWPLVVELDAALRAVDADPSVRVVVVTGAGRDFSVGADLARVASSDQADHDTRTLRGHSVEDDRSRLEQASLVVQTLSGLAKPTIARITGACAGAGLSIALAADFRIASPAARFNTAFVGAGVSGDLGSAWLLTAAVGASRARSLLLDPVKLTAEQAAAVGLVTEVVPDADLRVAELAAKLAAQSALAMSYAKQNVQDAQGRDLAGYLDVEVPRMVECARSDGARAAARAFVGSRGSR